MEAEAQNPMIPSIALKLPQLEIIENLLKAALDGTGQRLYTLQQAHARKYGVLPGGVSYSTIGNYLAMQPRGGIPDGWCSGRKVWKADTVEEWCTVDDQKLEEYLACYAPHVGGPTRIKAANKRNLCRYPSNELDEYL